MSFNVLVIPEDPVQNGHILRPLVSAILRDAGKPAAKVKVLDRPRVQGYGQAVEAIRNQVHNFYRHVDLWLFFPDADKAKAQAMQSLEKEMAGKGIELMCCIVQPELEVYACASFRREMGMPWEEVRRHSQLKEKLFRPLLAKHGRVSRPDGGRREMLEKALNNLPQLLRFCPELKELRDRIKAHIESL